MLKPKDKRIEIIPEGEQKVVEVCREGIAIGDKKTLTLKQGDNVVEYDGSEEKTFEVADVDLSDYYTKTEIDAFDNAKADKAGGVKLIAHRGSQFNAPENTIPAFETAGQQGFYGIEFDVQKTSDGEYVVLHDRNVARTTDGDGNVDDMTLAEVEALTIDSGTDIAVYPGLKVPTLDQVLKTIRKFNSVPVIEIKADTITADDVQGIMDIVEANGMANKAIFISFNGSIVKEVKRISPGARVWYLCGTPTTAIIDYCVSNDFGLDADTWTNELVAYANEKHVEVAEWTITSNTQYNSSVSNGVEFITTNAIEYCRDATPVYVGEFGIKAFSDYEKECLATNRIINRQLAWISDQTAFDAVVNSYKTAAFEMARGFFPRVYSLNGATSISYDFEDSKYDDVKVTFRFFNAQHQQLSDISWLSHSAKTFSNIPAGAAYFIVYCAGRSDTLKEYDRNLLNEMVRSISLSYGGA